MTTEGKKIKVKSYSKLKNARSPKAGKIIIKSHTRITKPKQLDWKKIYFRINNGKLELTGDGVVELSEYLTHQRQQMLETLDAKVAFLSLKYPKKIIQAIREALREEVFTNLLNKKDE